MLGRWSDLSEYKDYIHNIADLSGGKYAAKYINYGKVLTKAIILFLLVTVLHCEYRR